MSFDLEELRAALAAHGRVARVVVAEVAGSAPREPGAAMLVWKDGQAGTIGGGALEWEAAARARERLASGEDGPLLLRQPLGPGLGQCCGGAVVLVTEVFVALPEVQADVVVRRVSGPEEMPLALRRLVARARDSGLLPGAQLLAGWLLEPVARPRRALWIWGAGHVGRALVGVLAPLPEFAITWVDTAPERFPADIPAGVTCRVTESPAGLVAGAPAFAEHLILTYSHTIDLDLCHRLLLRGFARAGLIGSASKWARFRSRLSQLGHSSEAIARIVCPIGDPGLGKHPQAIALGVATALLQQGQEKAPVRAKGDSA